LLLVWCQLDHAPLVIGMDGREDPAIGPEVGMPHVRALDGALHPERDASEVVGIQLIEFPWVLTAGVGASWLRRAESPARSTSDALPDPRRRSGGGRRMYLWVLQGSWRLPSWRVRNAYPHRPH